MPYCNVLYDTESLTVDCMVFAASRKHIVKMTYSPLKLRINEEPRQSLKPWLCKVGGDRRKISPF